MKKVFPSIIISLINIIRIFVILGAITYVAIQTLEIFQRREFMHLTIFTLFFLFANFQLSISGYFLRIGMDKFSHMVFPAVIIMFSAGVLQLVDVAIDHLLKDISDISILGNSPIIIIGSLIEYLIALSSIFIAMVSLNRFKTTLKSWIPEFVKEYD